MANKIVILDDLVINKIAAGEVVERPASVVKELIENSIDAGANNIIVEVQDGGKKLVKVTDNGVGMSREDAILSLERHATSKIKTVDDLYSISSLGFRGEALPSIAAVSKLQLVTCAQKQIEGTQLMVEAGKIVDVKETGAPRGTSVAVQELFYNTPARQKFLKGAAVEMGHIVELVTRYALAFHGLAFRLLHNNQEVFRSPGDADLYSSIVSVYGKETAKQLIPVKLFSPSMRLFGFISQPNLTRANRTHQCFFVNKRLVKSKVFAKAVDDSYHSLVAGRRFPIAILFLVISPNLVDVNVHPTKREVRFHQEWHVYNFINKALKQALTDSGIIPELSLKTVTATRRPVKQKPLIEPTISRAIFTQLPQDKTKITYPQEIAQLELPEAGEIKAVARLGPVTPIAQIQNTYILTEGTNEILLIDQHAAHERVVYEKLMHTQAQAPIEIQRLMVPLTLELTHRELAVIEENRSTLAESGFYMEPFGKNTFVVRSVPAFLAHQDYKQILRDIIDELTTLTTSKQLSIRRENIITTVACKTAIKAGQPLTTQEINQLIQDLQQTQLPYICPHGRPTIISLAYSEIERKFKRV